MKITASIPSQDVGTFTKAMQAIAEGYLDEVEKEFILTGTQIEKLYKLTVPRVHSRLASSMHVEAPGTGSYSYTDSLGNTYKGSLLEQPKRGEVFVGSNVVYANPIERGRTKSGQSDFLKDSFEANIRGIEDRIKRRLSK